MKTWATFLLLLALVACAPSQASIATAIAQTQAALPMATASLTPLQPVPTETATVAATATPRPPTPTPMPTNTPRPTNTAAPTASWTPLPPPAVVSGTGDQIVDVENPYEAAIVHITGNKSRRYFGVTNYGAGNETYDMLVNTGDPYDGVRPIDFEKGQHTVRFEVKASDAWTIEIRSLDTAHAFNIPGSFTGTGDDVVLMLNGDPDTAHITGNKGRRYFGVTAYGTDGSIDLLVNTGDPYDGTVLMSAKALVLEVRAEGEWTVDVKTK